ncbi:hypothetical protein TRE132_03340 [Pseudomonas chlororaphis subsp. aurantiaca]|nr:hypothetical protein TRE132_03340 [Pseudomonas chlororaphis subsp. aurantiaca]
MSTPITSDVQVVLIDDDPHLRQALSQTLDLAGLKILPLGEAQGLAARLERDWPGWWSATSACPAWTASNCSASCTARILNCQCC